MTMDTSSDNLTKFCDHCRDVSAILLSPAPHRISVTECPCKCHYYAMVNLGIRNGDDKKKRRKK